MPRMPPPPAPPPAPGDRYRALYPYAALFVAVLCVGAGVGLFALGASGEADWEATFIWGVHLKVNTGAPGIVCFVVAAVIVTLSRPKRI